MLATPQQRPGRSQMQKQRDPIASSSGLSGSTALRLHNQLERALQQSFGAEEGLRVLVTLATTQMMASGCSRTAIRNALSRVVSEHQPGEVVLGRVAREQRAVALTAMMLKWSDSTSRSMTVAGKE
jgi:hypothetical protein